MYLNREPKIVRRRCAPLAAFTAALALQLAAFAASAPCVAQEAEAARDSVRTVLITGSNRGIGLAFARHYAEQANWRVIATCRRPEQAEDLKALAAERENLRIELLDVTREDHILGLAERYADQPIDLLINNAAILGPRPEQSLGSLDYDRFQQTMAVNVYGPLRMSEALADNVVAAGGKIVALTSGLASMTLMGRSRMQGFYFYRMSKSALNMGWQALRSDLKPRGVVVLLVSPGQVDTRMLRESGYRGEALTTEESVAGMARIIADATLEDPGLPINVDGQVLPW